jgi:hypothetical protein
MTHSSQLLVKLLTRRPYISVNISVCLFSLSLSLIDASVWTVFTEACLVMGYLGEWISILDLRFSQRWIWTFLSSVVRWKSTDVSYSWRRYVPPTRWLTSIALHHFKFQKIELCMEQYVDIWYWTGCWLNSLGVLGEFNNCRRQIWKYFRYNIIPKVRLLCFACFWIFSLTHSLASFHLTWWM